MFLSHPAVDTVSSLQTCESTRRDTRMQVNRNAILLPPIQSVSPSSSAVRGEAGWDNRGDRTKKTHGSSSPVGSKNLHDCDIPRDSPGGHCTTSGKGIDEQDYPASSWGEDQRGVTAADDAQDDTGKGENDSKTDEAPDGILLDPNISGGAEMFSVGEAGRGRNPVSPVAAMRTRLGGGLRNLLALGSEAQVSPGSGSPSYATVTKSRAPEQNSRSPGGKTAADGESLAAEQDVNGDLDGRFSARNGCAPQAIGTAGPSLAPETLRRVLARDNTLTPADEWPDLLDDEADPADWALGKGEAEVLAAARLMGSVLVRVVTWNLHAKPPPAAETLREHLLPPGKFHIYAVGTEECLHSIAKSVIVHSKKEWENLLKEALGDSYEMLCAHGLQATHNVVFAHRAILPLLRNVRSCAVATGLSLGSPGTTLGNKGGVGISFDIGATSCVFINSHLAAHQNNVRERNDHFFAISQGLVRELGSCTVSSRGGSPPLAEGLPLTTAPEPGSEEPTLGTMEYDSRGVAKGGGDSSGGGTSAVAPPDAVTGRGCCGGGVQDHRIEVLPSSNAVSRGEGGIDPECTDEDEDVNRTLPALARSPSKAAATAASSTLSQSPIEMKEAQSKRSRAEAQPRTNLAGFGGVTADACSTPPLTPDPQITSNSPPGSRHQQSEHQHGLQAGRGRTEARVEGGARDLGSKTLPQVFDRVVWAGDLNYRINAPRAVADLLLSKDMHEVLLNNEQLSLERARDGGGKIREGGGGNRGGLFSGYSEGPLNFRPTYKFDTGTDTYDTSSKQRVPAWTDRILYSGAGEAGVSTSGMQLRAYRSVGELKTSDHRPVLASFVMKFDSGGGGDLGSEAVAVTNQTSSQVCSVM